LFETLAILAHRAFQTSVLRSILMQLSQVYLGLGEPALGELLKGISLGKLKTFQLYERLKLRLHLSKLNSETLRRSASRLWPRLQEGDEDLANELGQAILISHMDMIMAVLDFLKIPHEEGFFAKDIDSTQYLTEGWQQRVFDEFKDKFPPQALLFYVNHLGWEVAKSSEVFAPAA
jgi:hypothetical protein